VVLSSAWRRTVADVVPGALYRHVRNKDQLRDLVVDGMLAEVDCQVARTLRWSEQVLVLASRLRAVLERHPGIAGLLKTRDPLGPNSLALPEAFTSGPTAGTSDLPPASGRCSAGSKQPSARLTGDFSTVAGCRTAIPRGTMYR
jgi:AcrR family transcriptional regulator